MATNLWNPNYINPGAGVPKSKGSGLSSALGIVSSFANPIGAGIGAIAPLVQMFTSGRGRQRETAVSNQRSLEQWMQGVQARVQAGTMDEDTAIAAIQNMMNQSQGGAQTEEDARGLAEAGRMASQLIANLQNSRTIKANAPFQAGESALTGGSGLQKLRGQTLMRNMLMGTESGKAFGAGTPAGKLLAARAEPGQQFQQYMGQVAKPTDRSQGDELMKSIASYRTRFGG